MVDNSSTMTINKAIELSKISKKYRIGRNKEGTLVGGLSRFRKFNLSIRESEFWALNDVSFEIKKGEVVGIIGKNGAGKSTLLKILSQITKPTIGRIEIHGRIASLLEVGTGFHPELTGRENIYLNGTILGMTRQEVKEKFDEIVSFSGVEKFLDTPVKHYSSGMYVRLAFAVAAHLDPEILIIDEVLAVGDAEFQKKCLGKMREVAVNGRTVIFVSHDLGMIEKLCSRVIWIENGRLKDDGTPSKIIRAYTSNLDSEIVSDRKTDKPIFFQNLSLHDSNLNIKNVFRFNEKITIQGNLIINEPQARSFQLCIALLDKMQRRVFSQVENFNPSERGKFVFNLDLPKELLAPNTYSFLVQIYPPPGIEITDELFGILNFEIIDNGTKLSGYKDYGVIHLSDSITIKPEYN